MIQKIKKQIEEHLENITTPINYHVLLQKIKFEVIGILNYHKSNMNILDFKVICDNTNNTDNNFITCQAYIKEKNYIEIRLLEFTIHNDKKKIIKNLRRRKLEKIDIISKSKNEYDKYEE